jgi:hypothetical protein
MRSRLLATLALIAVLALARSAQAETTPVPGSLALPATAAASGPEEAEEEEFEWESEAEEEEREEAEAEGRDEPPAACVLRTARATMVAYESQSKLRLLVSYTSFAPAQVAIEYRLHDGRGSLDLGREQRRLAYAGVVRDTERLGRARMARVLRANDLTVELRVLSAPSSCRRYGTRELKSRRATPGRVTWTQSSSVFGT